MQQADAILGHLQFFGDDFLEVFNGIVMVNGDRKGASSRRIDVQRNRRLVKLRATPKVLVNVLRIAAHFTDLLSVYLLYLYAVGPERDSKKARSRFAWTSSIRLFDIQVRMRPEPGLCVNYSPVL